MSSARGAVAQENNGRHWWSCNVCACAFSPLLADRETARRAADEHNRKEHPALASLEVGS